MIISEKRIVQNKSKQRLYKMFFAVMRGWGYEGETAKNMIKSTYNVEHYRDLTPTQISDYLTKLEAERW